MDKQREQEPGRGLGRTAQRVRSVTSAGLLVLGVLLIPVWSGLGDNAQAATEQKPIAAKVPVKKAVKSANKKRGAGATKLAQADGEKTKTEPKAQPKPQRGQPITLNFKDADIQSVVGAFGHLLNRTFVIDQRVVGKITLETPKPIALAQAYEMLLSTLRLHGFAIVDSGSFAKVVPEADAKLQYGPVTVGEQAAHGGDQIVTQIFRINYESATNLIPVLRPLITANNTITAYANNNSLVVTDYASNLQRIARIIATIDSPSTSEVDVVTLKNSVASDVAVSVSKLLDEVQRSGPAAATDSGRVIVLADPRVNSILIRSSSVAKVNLAKTLIARLDQPGDDKGNIHVVYLRNAEAVKLAETLRAVLGDSSGSSATTASKGVSTLSPSASTSGASAGGTAATTPLQGSSQGPLSISAGGAVIAADPSTNSLIITAPLPVYRNLRTVIERLDTRRAQVYIESLIVEVSAEKAAELGIQWQFLNAPEGTTRIIGGTNLPARGAGGNILDATTNLGAIGQGLNLGIVRGTTELPGVGTVLNLGLLARALENDANANILATPNLLTLDNEEARIIIGQNVPFVTGSYLPPTNGGTSNTPFQTIERKDVGTTLRVKPQVSENGAVKMAIFQEVSSVLDASLAAGLITKKRSIESNVLVDDGQIVVLGGLIEETLQDGTQAVPGLGSIPGLGQLFRYDTRKRVKTNLLVFLRPVIVRDTNAAYRVTADRYDYIRQLRGDSRMKEHWLLPDMPQTEMPVLPVPPAGKAPADKEPVDGKQGSVLPGPLTPGTAQNGSQQSLAAIVAGHGDVAPAREAKPAPPVPSYDPQLYLN